MVSSIDIEARGPILSTAEAAGASPAGTYALAARLCDAPAVVSAHSSAACSVPPPPCPPCLPPHTHSNTQTHHPSVRNSLCRCVPDFPADRHRHVICAVQVGGEPLLPTSQAATNQKLISAAASCSLFGFDDARARMVPVPRKESAMRSPCRTHSGFPHGALARNDHGSQCMAPAAHWLRSKPEPHPVRRARCSGCCKHWTCSLLTPCAQSAGHRSAAPKVRLFRPCAHTLSRMATLCLL